MASIRLKDYLESLSTKGTISDNDLVPLLDSDSTNALKTTTKGILTNLSSITGFTNFSSSVVGTFNTLTFASSSNVSTSLQQSVDIAVLGAYTASQNLINTTNTNHRSAVNIQTGSQNLVNLGISTYTGSNELWKTGVRGEITGLEAYTSSLKGAIEISGQDVNILGMLTAQQFNITRVSSSVQYQSGSTEFGDTSDDTHTFIGTLSLNGSAIGLSELNSYTSSQNIINTSVDSHILGVATQTGSQDLVNLGISTFTGSQNVINNSVDSHILKQSTQTGSQDLVNLGISTYTGSNELWKAGVRGEISGIEAWTASLDSTYATDAQLYQLYQATASIHSTTQSLNTQTGSQNLVNLGISTFTGSQNVINSSVDSHILKQATQTGSQDLVNLSISTFTGSLRSEVNLIEAYTASLKAAAIVSSSSQILNYNILATTGSNTFVGNQTITGSFLVSGSTTQIGNNTLAGNTLLSGSIGIVGNSTLTGSFLVSGSTTQIGNNTLLGNTILSGSIEVIGTQLFVGTNTLSGSSLISGSSIQFGDNTLIGDNTITGSNSLLGNNTIEGKNTIIGNTVLSGSIEVSGSFTGSMDIAGNLNIASGSGFYRWGNKLFNYGQWTSLETQTGSANTAYPMKLEVPVPEFEGIYVGNNASGFPTRIYAEYTGLYNIQFSAQLHTTSNESVDFSVWLAMTGSNIANSNTDFSIEKVTGGGFQVAALNFLTPITSGSYVELYFSKTTENGQLQYKGTQVSPTRPATPSVIVTVTQVA